MLGRPEPIPWAKVDYLDRDLYRQRAKVVIGHLGLTEERGGLVYNISQCRLVSQWWDEP